MGLFGRRSPSRRSDDAPAKKAKKEVDEFKNSHLAAGAKLVMKSARKEMGSHAVPCRSAALLATMKDLRAGRYGGEPMASIIKERVAAIFGDHQMNAMFEQYEEDEFGGLTSDSAAWQISAAWRLLGDVFVIHWVRTLAATQAGVVSIDFDSTYQAVVGHDATVALSLWDGKAFTNGAASPVTVLVRAAATKMTVPLKMEVTGGRGGSGDVRGSGGRGGRGGGQPYKRICNYCKVKYGVIDESHLAAACPRHKADFSTA